MILWALQKPKVIEYSTGVEGESDAVMRLEAFRVA